jgi:hypothetical protein
MNIIFTRSNNLISKLICAITKEPFSHVAISPFPECVLHSTFTGVNFISMGRFLAAHSTVIPVRVDIPYEAILPIVHKNGKALYDFKALLFVGAMLLLRRWFPKLVPKQNLWQTSGMYMCTEFVTLILGEVDSMITPYQLYVKLTTESK